MGFKEFIKAKSVGEYLEAKKDPRQMKEINDRSFTDVIKNTTRPKDKAIFSETLSTKKVEQFKFSTHLVTLDESGVTVELRGLMKTGAKFDNAGNTLLSNSKQTFLEKKIFYKNINSINFKKGGLTNGFLEITSFSNYPPNDFTIIVRSSQNKLAEELKKEIESRIEQKSDHHSKSSPIEEIKGLKELLDIGAITQSEFDLKKKELLNL
jgi:hypothetical protein